MKETIEGIILNETNYGETSKILNILTFDHGYISVMSKGSRTMKSKLRGISMKFVYASFTINYKEKGISTLIEGSIINSLKNTMTDFSKMIYLNRIVNIVKQVLKDYNDKNLFPIVRDALLKIEDGFDPKVISMIVEVKLLTFLGVKPNFLECSLCGSQEILTFDLNIPGSVCKNCYQESFLFSKNTLKLLNLFQNIDIFKIDKLNLTSNKIIEELEFFLKEYYEEYTGIFLEIKKIKV